MGKLESALKAEIVRLARKEAKATSRPVSQEVVRLKKTVAELRRTINQLRKDEPGSAPRPSGVPGLATASADEMRKARFSPGLIQKLRKRLGITQSELATLLGVTPGAVAFWEQGRSRPRETHQSKIVTLRKLGKRDVGRLLTQGMAPGKAASRKRRSRKAATKAAPKKKSGRRSRR